MYRVPFSFCITVLLLAVFAATGQTPPESADILKVKSDSLQARADSLEAKAQQLEKQLDSSGSGNDDLKSRVKREIDNMQSEIIAIRDTIVAMANNVFKPAEAVQHDAPEEPQEQIQVVIEEREVKKSYGSFIIALEYTKLDVDPLENLAEHDRSLAGKHFDFSDNRMMTFGLMGYYSKDKSMRFGNGIFAGYKLYQSDIYDGARPDTLHESAEVPDSVITLRVIPTSFGFLCEKAFVNDPVNFFAGGMLGGNLTVVVKEEQEAREVSSFIDDDDFNDDEDGRFSVALSWALSWDIHGGMAFKLSDNLNVGIDGVLRCAYAYEGFGAGFGDFLSVSPGLRLRLTFGSAG